jgi:hypothetical protein
MAQAQWVASRKNQLLVRWGPLQKLLRFPLALVDSFHESKGIRWETPFPKLALRGFPGDCLLPGGSGS